jgi:hypothetical protein
MRRIRWLRALLISAIALLVLFAGPAHGSYRALSLKVLQSHLKSGAATRDVQSLAGLTSIVGYVLDEANQDVVIFGEVNSDRPVLPLDDLMVAMRNSWMRYTRGRDGGQVYLAPYCSIEPDLRSVEGLNKSRQQISNAPDSGSVEPAIKQWQQYCATPQRVVVKGIPFYSHFASVLVKSDYLMKKLAVGCETIELSDFVPLSEMALQKLQADFSAEGRLTSGSSIGNRFWFYPDDTEFLEHDGIVTLDVCKVTLLTEESFLDRSGQIKGEGKASEAAESFAERFTRQYMDIASVKPVYFEFQNLFDIFALSKGMKFKAHPEAVSLDLGYLLDKGTVSRTTVEEHLPGGSTVKYFEQPVERAGKRQTAKVWIPFCGGVMMNIEVGDRNFRRDHSGKLVLLRQRLLESRPGADALFWSFTP